MVPTLIATPGSASANAYCTVLEADAYQERRLHTDDWPAQIAATASIGSGANGVVTITSVALGVIGNAYQVQVAIAGGASAALAVALVGSILTITLGTDGASAADATKNTATLITAAINALDEFTATASGTGATALATASGPTSFTGGDDRDAIKIPALLMATRLLDALYRWEGFAVTETQALAWPRVGLITRNGFSIGETTIPTELKDATAEFARQLIAEDLAANNDAETEGLRSLRAGPVTLEFRDNVTAKVVPDAVFNLLPPEWGYVRTRRPKAFELVRS